MRFYIGIADYDWFTYLKSQNADEANFWQPSGSNQFRALSPGDLFLFKLHSPRNYIVGGGFFSHFSLAPISFAWEAFGTKNGAQSLLEMRYRVEKYRHLADGRDEDYVIGCILLQRTFFWHEPDWIPIPNWPASIVRGKGYDETEDNALEIWNDVHARLAGREIERQLLEATADTPRHGAPQLILPRLGQGAFRIIVADTYRRRCAVTSSHILHVLEASHIRPYGKGGTHSPDNGVLLRSDVHTLFDRGYLTITPDFRLEVSSRIKTEFDNGAEYYALHGKNVAVPDRPDLRPSGTMLTWHNENVFRI
jgi:putative restriction endonuclease